MKYTGMAMKMALVILAGVLGGRELDERSSLEFPLWTLVLSLVGVALAIYFVIKDTSR
jgi:membrane protein DedA with SNARE-associated domain